MTVGEMSAAINTLCFHRLIGDHPSDGQRGDGQRLLWKVSQ